MGHSQQIASLNCYIKMVATSLPTTRQVILLCDAVIHFLKYVQEAMREQRHEDCHEVLQRANRVVMGLQGALDFEKGGDVAKALDSFYEALSFRILALNRSSNTDECAQIIREIKMMRDAWDKLAAENGELRTAPLPFRGRL